MWLVEKLEVLCLVLSAFHTKRILDAKTDEEVSSELRSVCASSGLGNKLFGHRLMLLAVKEYIKAVRALCAEHMSDKISQAELDLCHKKAAEHAEEWEFDKRWYEQNH